MHTLANTWGQSRGLLYALCALLLFQTMMVTLGVHYDHLTNDHPAGNPHTSQHASNTDDPSMVLDLAGLQEGSDSVGCDVAEHCCHSQLPVLALPNIPKLNAALHASPVLSLDVAAIPFPPTSGLFRPPIV